jgi:hypothetical protein
MSPRVVHFYFPIFGTLFIPIDMRLPELFNRCQKAPVIV